MKFTSSSSIYICILVLSILSLSISILAAPTQADIPGPTSDKLPDAIGKSATGTKEYYELQLDINECHGCSMGKRVGPILRQEANGVVFSVPGGWLESGRGLEAKRFDVERSDIDKVFHEIDTLEADKALVVYGWNIPTGRSDSPGRNMWAIYDKPAQNPEGSPASEAKPETASDEPGKR